MGRLTEEAELVFVFAKVGVDALALERTKDVRGAVGLGCVFLERLEVVACVLFFFLRDFEGVACGGDYWEGLAWCL